MLKQLICRYTQIKLFNSYIPIIIPGLTRDISGGTIRFHFRNVLPYFHITKIFHNIYRFYTT